MLQPVLTTLLLIVFAQSPDNSASRTEKSVPPPSVRAVSEIKAIISEANKLTDPIASIKVRARAAQMLWAYDRAAARKIFLDLWKWVEEQDDKNMDRESARTVILKNLFRRDPRMASHLLETTQGKQKAEESPLIDQVRGNDPNLKRLNRISADLIGEDLTTAAALLQRSLSVSVSPAAFFSLLKLRDKNPALADYVVSQTLESLKSRPTLVALTGTYLLIDYVFPSKQSFGESLNDPPDAALYLALFSTAYDTLKRSLAEDEPLLKEQKYSSADLRMKANFQGILALVLAGLAPAYAPEQAQELNALSAKLSQALPPNTTQNVRFTVARIVRNQTDHPEENIIHTLTVAVSRGETGEARRLLDKIDDEKIKKAFATMIANVEFRTHMSKSELAEALIALRRIEDPNLQSPLFAQVARAAFKRGEIEFSRLILAEARETILKAECNGLQAKALFLLAAESASVPDSNSQDLLYAGVSCLNYMARTLGMKDEKKGGIYAALPELNDPAFLIDEPELWRAFSVAGSEDFESAVHTASLIENRAVGLMAQLSACEDLAASKKGAQTRRPPTDQKDSSKSSRPSPNGPAPARKQP